jgi:glycosyltransferase involved in cell wall biosynthesis
MKGLFIIHSSDFNNQGLMRKITSQINIMCSKNISFDLKVIKFKKLNHLEKILRRFPLFNIDPVIVDIPFNYSYDFIYSRYFFSEYKIPFFLLNYKKLHPNCKIFVEFFDWPRHTQFNLFYNYFLISKESYAYKKIASSITNFITYSNIKSIFGVNTISSLNYVNGLDFKDFPKPIFSEGLHSNKVQLVAVGGMKLYHGYDRLIIGLHNYLNDKRIMNKMNFIIHIIGDGPEIKNYKKIALRLNLQDKITFHGSKDINFIADLYNNSSLAVGSLGLHRIKISSGSSLKTSEYLYYGLPVLYSSNVELFKIVKNEFTLKFPNNDSPIDFLKIQDFYYSLINRFKNFEELKKKVHEFSIMYCSIQKTFSPILERIIN